jgi:hypothetical protein
MFSELVLLWDSRHPLKLLQTNNFWSEVRPFGARGHDAGVALSTPDFAVILPQNDPHLLKRG